MFSSSQPPPTISLWGLLGRLCFSWYTHCLTFSLAKLLKCYLVAKNQPLTSSFGFTLKHFVELLCPLNSHVAGLVMETVPGAQGGGALNKGNAMLPRHHANSSNDKVIVLSVQSETSLKKTKHVNSKPMSCAVFWIQSAQLISGVCFNISWKCVNFWWRTYTFGGSAMRSCENTVLLVE